MKDLGGILMIVGLIGLCIVFPPFILVLLVLFGLSIGR